MKLLKEQKQGLKAWTGHIIIFVAFNWSHLYISMYITYWLVQLLTLALQIYLHVPFAFVVTVTTQ